ncbi:MAG: HD domain-containing phosphohydrolase [Anaerovoracaceae bacterium]|jgi:putative nucleotidyltransferase with HDIG domain
MRIKKNNNELNNFSILALDDDPIMTITLQSYFQASGYKVDVENDPYAAIEAIRNGSYDILLLDFLMSPICGDQVVQLVREFNNDLFIILLTGHKSLAPPLKTIRELDIQGYYEKSDRFDQLELLVESCVKSIRQMRTIKTYQEELHNAYTDLQNSYAGTISAIRQMVDAKDIYTRGHSDRVAIYGTLLSKQLGKDEAFSERVRVAGLFHDIGKMGIPDRLLLKDTVLTKEEFAIIKEHPLRGYQILSSISLFHEIAPIVLNHHERIDGNGYPNGLKGEQIPLESKIISIVDAFDAMTSNRQYRSNFDYQIAISQLQEGKETQFCGSCVDAFLEVLKNRDIITKELAWTYAVEGGIK